MVPPRRLRKLQPANQTKMLIKPNGKMKLVKQKATLVITYKEDKFSCPFCLYTDRIAEYLIKLKSGRYSEKRVMCPDCGKIMNIPTLTRNQTVEEFAEWFSSDLSYHQLRRFKQYLTGLITGRERGYLTNKEENPRERSV